MKFDSLKGIGFQNPAESSLGLNPLSQGIKIGNQIPPSASPIRVRKAPQKVLVDTSKAANNHMFEPVLLAHGNTIKSNINQ